MVVYRIAKTEARARDLSGFGAFKYGGRWNSKGIYVLYTSMNSSLAYLENLVHFNDRDEVPPSLYIASIEINDATLIYQLADDLYPLEWQLPDNPENKLIGDKWVNEKKIPIFKVRSAINPSEFNFLLNTVFPGYHEMAVLASIEKLNIDSRFAR